MNAHSWTVEQCQATNGASIELATLHHEGRDFSAMGSIVDEANGILVGYVRERDGRLELGTFDGSQVLCPLALTATYDFWPRNGYGRVKMRCYRATYNGRTYTGRHGDMDLLRMRARPLSFRGAL